MKTIILSGLESLREYKDLLTIAVIVVVINLLFYIKQTAKLEFKTMLLNSGIAIGFGFIACMIVIDVPLVNWIKSLIVALVTFVAIKMDVYIYKILDIVIGLFKSRAEKVVEKIEETATGESKEEGE